MNVGIARPSCGRMRGAVRVEDPHDRRVDALLPVVRHRQRLRVALRLVVDPARADRVHVAPVGLGLRVDLRIAVHLARRGEQEPGPVHLRQSERVVRPVRADLERLQREPQVVDRARGAREVVDEVEGLGELHVVREVLRQKGEGVAPQVLDVRQGPRLEVVEADDAVTLREQRLTEVRAEKTRAAGHEGGRHRARSYPPTPAARDRAYEVLTSPASGEGLSPSLTIGSVERQ